MTRGILLLLLALGTACGSDEAAPVAPPPERRPEGAAAAPGSATLAISERGVTLDAREVPLSRLLGRLGQQARFHVVGALANDRLVTLEADGAPLAEILSQLLAGEPYALRYAVDEATGAHRLERLTLGSFESELMRVRQEERAERRRRSAQTRRGRGAAKAPPAAEEREQRALGREEREREIAAALGDPDPAVRAGAVSRIDPDEGAPRLVGLLGSDPDAAVRAAAASQLATSDSQAAVGALVAALGDPDARVVLEALDSLQFRMDETLVPQIRPLLEHPAPEVRARAAEAIEFLE